MSLHCPNHISNKTEGDNLDNYGVISSISHGVVLISQLSKVALGINCDLCADESKLGILTSAGRQCIGGNKEGAILRAHQKTDFGAIPYFLVIADYEKAFLYVATGSWDSFSPISDEQGPTDRKHLSVL
jgi:hypothetical protein